MKRVLAALPWIVLSGLAAKTAVCGASSWTLFDSFVAGLAVGDIAIAVETWARGR